MIKDNAESLKNDYKALKGKGVKRELMLGEMKSIVKFKGELDDCIESLKNVLRALDEAAEYGKTFGASKASIEKEIRNLQVLLETL